MGDTTIISTDYDHMPDEAMRLSMDGMTLREALASLRVPNGRAEFGDIGGCRCDLMPVSVCQSANNPVEFVRNGDLLMRFLVDHFDRSVQPQNYPLASDDQFADRRQGGDDF